MSTLIRIREDITLKGGNVPRYASKLGKDALTMTWPFQSQKQLLKTIALEFSFSLQRQQAALRFYGIHIFTFQ